MKAFILLYKDWPLLVTLLALFAGAYVSGRILFVTNNELALKILKKLDTPRKEIVRTICKNLFMPYGVARAVFLIFFINLINGSFFWLTIGGIFLVAPFVQNIATGLLTGLALSNYPERANWLTFFNVLFEIGAFVTAGVAGIRIGLSIWGPTKILPAIFNWGKIFLTVVIPLQFLGAVFEGLLFKRLYVQKKFPLPYGLSRDSL